jgi:hypothetical protein
VREPLVVTGMPPALALPAVVFFELSPAFRLPDPPLATVGCARGSGLAPPGDGSPPMPLLVARTMVRLV